MNIDNISFWKQWGLDVKWVPYKPEPQSDDPKGMIDAIGQMAKGAFLWCADKVKSVAKLSVKKVDNHPIWAGLIITACLISGATAQSASSKPLLVGLIDLPLQPSHPLIPSTIYYNNRVEMKGKPGIDDDEDGCTDNFWGCIVDGDRNLLIGINRTAALGHEHPLTMLNTIATNLKVIETEQKFDPSLSISNGQIQVIPIGIRGKINIQKAVRLAQKQNVDVINMSIGVQTSFAVGMERFHKAILDELNEKIVDYDKIVPEKLLMTCDNPLEFTDAEKSEFIDNVNTMEQFHQSLVEFPGIVVVAAGNSPDDLSNYSTWIYPQIWKLSNVIIVTEEGYLDTKTTRISPLAAYNAPSFMVAECDEFHLETNPCSDNTQEMKKMSVISCDQAKKQRDLVSYQYSTARKQNRGPNPTDDQYNAAGGTNTSHATAKTTAMIATMRKIDPSLTIGQIKHLIKKTSTRIKDIQDRTVYKLNRKQLIQAAKDRIQKKTKVEL